MNIPRPTGMDIGTDGRLFVASWRGGEASVYVGPQVGFIACITPPGWRRSPRRTRRKPTLPSSSTGCAAPLAPVDLHCQREIIRRGRSPETTRALVELASDRSKPSHARVAALFALKQLDGKGSHATLRKLAEDAAVREFALRALADRKTELDGVDSSPFIAALEDPSPRVRAQALIALGRLGDVAAAARIIPLTSRPQGSPMPTTRPVQAQPDPDRVAAPSGVAGPGHPQGGRRLPRGDRRSASRGGPPRLAVPARAEGRRRADQEADARRAPRGAPRHPGDAGAPVSPRGGL